MLRKDLGPVTVVREFETTKRQVRHRLWEQRKVPGSLLEDSVPLPKTCEDCNLS